MSPEDAIATLAAASLEHVTDQEERLVILDALHSLAHAAGVQERALTAQNAAAHLRYADELQLQLLERAPSPDRKPASSDSAFLARI